MAVIRKRVLCPRQLRKVPPQFSWVDHRLVRDKHIAGKSTEALALYLFLLTVADGQGLSYYSDAGIGKLLPLDALALDRARQELIRARLIAYERPLYQVLSLDQPGSAGLPRGEPDGPRGGAPRTLGQILQQALDSPRLASPLTRDAACAAGLEPRRGASVACQGSRDRSQGDRWQSQAASQGQVGPPT